MPVSTCEGLRTCSVLESPSTIVTLWSWSSRFVIDTAWAAVVLDRSPIVSIAHARHTGKIRRKGCTPLGLLLLLLLRRFLLHCLLRFLRLHSMSFHCDRVVRIVFGLCQCENFSSKCQTYFS